MLWMRYDARCGYHEFKAQPLSPSPQAKSFLGMFRFSALLPQGVRRMNRKEVDVEVSLGQHVLLFGFSSDPGSDVEQPLVSHHF